MSTKVPDLNDVQAAIDEGNIPLARAIFNATIARSFHPLGEYERRSTIRALREYKQDYLGLAELAQVCGVQKNTCGNWRARGKLPPARELAMGPVWAKQIIFDWLLARSKS